MSVQRMTAILHKTDSNTTGGSSYQTDKQRYDLIQWLILYAKLFLLMGLTWITEIVSWAVGGPDYYWYFSDVLNLLRAVFIFILFICKRSVFESLRRKLLGKSRLANKESKSLSDVLSTSTSLRDSKGCRTNTNSKKRKESVKAEGESQKLIFCKKPGEENSKNCLNESRV
ncbi:hypothetical protein RUM44_002856 [Polyplax serrata]|uniref:Uncharacterized protein n=1 Tax=Polyplax serrata TaxID=468196 RepID=A0ABR1AWZ7_POLSC